MRDGLDRIFRFFGKEGCLAAEAERKVKELTNVFFHNSHICTSLAGLLTINVGTAYHSHLKFLTPYTTWIYSSSHIYFDEPKIVHLHIDMGINLLSCVAA